ncbi:hypothetical protein Tco_0517047 [Tanacetum coccineum]
MAATVTAAAKPMVSTMATAPMCHVWVHVWYASWLQVFTRPGCEPTSTTCLSSSESVTFQISEQKAATRRPNLKTQGRPSRPLQNAQLQQLAMARLRTIMSWVS